MSNRKKKEKKKQKKGTTLRRPQYSSSSSCCHASCCRSSPPFMVLLVTATLLGAVAGRCFAGSCCCRSSLLVVVAAGCGCWFAAVLFLFVAAALFKIYYRVGLGQVSPTPTAKKQKRPLFCLSRYSTMTRHGATISNPPHHRYSVAFFQNSATLFRHGRHLITLGKTYSYLRSLASPLPLNLLSTRLCIGFSLVLCL